MEDAMTTGFYLAKTGNCQWYNLIVQIYGRSPFFKLRAWDRIADKIVVVNVEDIKQWGRKIMEEDES